MSRRRRDSKAGSPILFIALIGIYLNLILWGFIAYMVFTGEPGLNLGRYDYFHRTKIEIKAWIDLDGKHGMEVVPVVSINGNHYNWVVGDLQPLWLDNRYRYTLTAPETLQGYCFLFWQRESDGLIIPNRTLVLEPGFTEERWWQNYGKCS